MVQGLAGLGKTVLAAEAIHLYHEQFTYVLAFQAKPAPLQLDDFFRKLDQRLMFESLVYPEKCDKNSYSHIYLEPNPQMYPLPEQRYERMRDNLVAALRDEALLLVVDNFESNLESIETAQGSSLYACSDPAWDDLLSALARDLPSTRSRLLVTTRHRPRALADSAATLWIPLGPLPMGEAGLYLRTRPELRRLLFGDDPTGKALVFRLLDISRGHPLILDRMAGLAADPPALSAALDRVASDGWKELPDLFAGAEMDDAQREREREYLKDVAVGSVDLLIERLSPAARRLLWIVTLANEPVSGKFIQGVWQGQSVEDEQLEKLRPLVLAADALPDDDPRKQKHLALIATDEGKRFMEQIRNPSPQSEAPAVGPLLDELHGAGLLAQEEMARQDGGLSAASAEERQPLEMLVGKHATYEFHELVRERIAAWMGTHADDRDPRTDDEIRIAYGERYAQRFDDLYDENREAAGEAGRRALVYFVASQLVIGVRDPTLLRGIIGELQGTIDQAPPGKPRWSLQTYLADALRRAGQPDQALPFYAAAAQAAEAAEHWSDVAWISGNWANAVSAVGDFDESKRLHLRSADVGRRAGRPEVKAIVQELEALRIDVQGGKVDEALPEIELRLARVRRWWQRSQAGEKVAEALERRDLGRVLVSGLDIAREANQSFNRWLACLDLLEESESAKRALGAEKVDLTGTRFNQYGPLMELGRLDEAQRVLEGCLSVFRSAGVAASEAKCLSGLAAVWDERNEPSEAIALERQALAVRNTLPDPSERAISHGNFGNYLERDGKPDEAAQHHVAGMAYALCIGLANLAGFHNLGIRARQALADGQRHTLPRLEAVLAQGEFAALGQFLDSRNVDRSALQAEIDQLVDDAHQTS